MSGSEQSNDMAVNNRACRDGEVFEKTSASLLARGFAKKLLHSRSE
jgi:hypothetical protein